VPGARASRGREPIRSCGPRGKCTRPVLLRGEGAQGLEDKGPANAAKRGHGPIEGHPGPYRPATVHFADRPAKRFCTQAVLRCLLGRSADRRDLRPASSRTGTGFTGALPCRLSRFSTEASSSRTDRTKRSTRGRRSR